jgi:hypothetical protein
LPKPLVVVRSQAGPGKPGLRQRKIIVHDMPTFEPIRPFPHGTSNGCEDPAAARTTLKIPALAFSKIQALVFLK